MSKFKIGDHVRVTQPTACWFDQTGVVADIQPGKPYSVFVDLDDGGQVAFRESELILADVVEGAGVIDDSPEIAPTVSDSDKLRLIADVVNGQTPFGTELANFRRRLLAVLSIGGQS